MILKFDNDDILEYASNEEKMILNGKRGKGTLGVADKVQNILIRVIKKYLTSLGRKMEDEHSYLHQITLKIEIEGKPFNIGLGGSVEYVFKIEKSS